MYLSEKLNVFIEMLNVFVKTLNEYIDYHIIMT